MGALSLGEGLSCRPRSLRRVLPPRPGGVIYRLRGLSWQQDGLCQDVSVVVLGLVATEEFGGW